MGKRKSKIGKQKQAKARSHGKRGNSSTGSLGGVSVTKGLGSKFQQQAKAGISTALLLEGRKNLGPKKSLNNGPKAVRPKKVFMSSQTLRATTKEKTCDENEDFQRQMASLQERQAASRNAGIKKKKSELLKEGAVAAVINSLQPASFSMQKTTTDLLHETVHQMESMTGVGQQTAESLKTPIRTNQSWAVPNKKGSISTNPFAALDDGDSDDERTESLWGVPSLQLAPASFTLLPRTTPTPATTPRREDNNSSQYQHDEIDPDL